MELKDFIAETLSEIAQGVRMAQERSASLDARINPFTGSTGRSRKVVDVRFNVAVSAASGKASKGGVGVLAGWVTVGGSHEFKNDQQAATTIAFEVPMILPSESDKEKHPKPAAPSPPRRNTFRARQW